MVTYTLGELRRHRGADLEKSLRESDSGDEHTVVGSNDDDQDAKTPSESTQTA